jgi:hypothetical protein
MSWNRFEHALKIIDTLVGIMMLGGLGLAYWTLKADYEWKQRQGLITLYQEWRAVLDQGSVRDSVTWMELSSNTQYLKEIASGSPKPTSKLKPEPGIFSPSICSHAMRTAQDSIPPDGSRK